LFASPQVVDCDTIVWQHPSHTVFNTLSSQLWMTLWAADQHQLTISRHQTLFGEILKKGNSSQQLKSSILELITDTTFRG
jgi:hypothetical protein